MNVIQISVKMNLTFIGSFLRYGHLYLWRSTMSKLTDIKSRIDQLDGGAFQNFCDAYLSCRDYKNGYSLGMNKRCVKSGQGLYTTGCRMSSSGLY